MNKQVIKSQKIVSKAVGVFSQAVSEVEKANEMLRVGLVQDSNLIENYRKQISDIERKIKEIESEKEIKVKEIANNEKLITGLKQFIKE